MFYIIEKQEQLINMCPFDDCFISFIPYNDNFHPKINSLTLIYIRDLTRHKGFIFCLNHNESLSLNRDFVEQWLIKNTKKLFVLDKKEALYYFPYPDKLFDIKFIDSIDLTQINITGINWYYSRYNNLPYVNRIIPISKHYEKNEKIFNTVFPIIQKYRADNSIYSFNNGPLTCAFHHIESHGIKLDKQCFIDCYGDTLKYPEFNILKGKIYSNYNLHTMTSRPSNTYNNINFAALDKNNGERLCYRPENDYFIECDIQGYHPRILGEMIGFDFPKDKNTYDVLGNILGVSSQEAKELTFKQIYGGVWDNYTNKPFFQDIKNFTEKIWDEYQNKKYYNTENRTFLLDENMNAPKLLNYIIQSKETSNNIKIIQNILDYLKNKKTKLILYTYDAFLFDYSKEDGINILSDIQKIINYPTNIKQGKSYHDLKKI